MLKITATGNLTNDVELKCHEADVIVDYLGEQFIVELKIWHGSEYNERGEQQLADYLEYFHFFLTADLVEVLDKFFQNQIHVKPVVPDKSDPVTSALCVNLTPSGFLGHEEI